MDLNTKLRSLADELAGILAQEIADVGSANTDDIREVIHETEIDVTDEISTWMSEHLDDLVSESDLAVRVDDLVVRLDDMPCVDELSNRLDDLEIEQGQTEKEFHKHLQEIPDLTLLADRVRLLELSVVPIVEHLANLMRDLTNLGLVHDSTQDEEITEATTRAQVTSEIPAEALDEVALDLH